MEQRITNDYAVLVLRDGTLIYLDQQQTSQVRVILTGLGTIDTTIQIGESLIMRDAVSHLVLIEGYEDILRRKKGEWKCKQEHWNLKTALKCSVCEKMDKSTVTLDNGDKVSLEDIERDRLKKYDNRQYERVNGKWRRKKS